MKVFVLFLVLTLAGMAAMIVMAVDSIETKIRLNKPAPVQPAACPTPPPPENYAPWLERLEQEVKSRCRRYY